MTTMDGVSVFYNYVPYAFPKVMHFSIHTGNYDLQAVERRLIIGESDDSYLTRLLKTKGSDIWDKEWYLSLIHI